MSLMAWKWIAVDFGGPEVLRNVEVDVPDPQRGQVTIAVRAAGMNPADAKHIAPGQDPKLLPLSLGYEVAGMITAFGPDTEIASGGGAVGDEVVAAMVDGGYTTAITVPASDVFTKPRTLSFPEAASGPFRARVRSQILKLAQDGDLVVPMAQTFQFADAPAAFAALTSPHPPGKLALVNEP